MSDQNPYIAPQASLGASGGLPMAHSSLPREMLVVAEGMKYVLWAFIIFAIAVVVGMILGGMAAAKLFQQAGNPAQLNPQQVAEIMLQPMLITAGIMFLGDLVRLFGLFKCTQIPVETGAKQMAQIALFSSIGVMLIGLFNNYMNYRSADLANPSGSLKILGFVATIFWLVTLFSFLSFLKKTAAYLGDALCIERANKLFTLSAVVGGCVVISQIMTLVASNANVVAQGATGGRILATILGLVMLVCGIWAFIVYLGTLTRIRGVIQNGIR